MENNYFENNFKFGNLKTFEFNCVRIRKLSKFKALDTQLSLPGYIVYKREEESIYLKYFC